MYRNSELPPSFRLHQAHENQLRKIKRNHRVLVALAVLWTTLVFLFWVGLVSAIVFVAAHFIGKWW